MWAFDEHRAGLKPVPRRIRTLKGRRPVATGRSRYEWLHPHGFIRPTSGAVESFPCNAVDTALFAAVLTRSAASVGAGADKTVVLVLDNTGWHGGGGKLASPEGLRRVFLPPRSPELQPAERLWPLTDEVVANENLASLAELDRALAERCLALTAQPDLIRAHTCFHWQPQVA